MIMADQGPKLEGHNNAITLFKTIYGMANEMDVADFYKESKKQAEK
jgi:hypothetical protein